MAYESVLECAISQIGEGNGPGKTNKYLEWYYGYPCSTYWCAIFMAWCFEQVGILDRLDGLTNKAGCEPWRRWAVSRNLWSTTPKVGAIVLYDWNPETGDGADHIGIVERIEANGIVAIEGNTSAFGSQTNGGYVMRKLREFKRIMGYVYIDTTAPVNIVNVYGEGTAGGQIPVLSAPDPKAKTKITLRKGQKVYCYGTHTTDGVEYWHIDDTRSDWVRKTGLKNRKTYLKKVVFTYGYGTVNSKTGVRIHSLPGMKYTTPEVIAEGTVLYCYGSHNADGYSWWAVNAARTKWVRKTSLRDRVTEKKWTEIN